VSKRRRREGPSDRVVLDQRRADILDSMLHAPDAMSAKEIADHLTLHISLSKEMKQLLQQEYVETEEIEEEIPAATDDDDDEYRTVVGYRITERGEHALRAFEMGETSLDEDDWKINQPPPTSKPAKSTKGRKNKPGCLDQLLGWVLILVVLFIIAKCAF
jgi:hypothetical protein